MYYEETLYPLQDSVLTTIDQLNTPFYLTGGTALSRFYYHHRYSDDLDLFVNNNDEFVTLVETIINALNPFNVDIKNRSKTYYSLIVNTILKVDFVNDVPSHIGSYTKTPIFSRVDNITNIVSNKISALYSRDEPKDVVDIWVIAKNSKLNWKQIFQDVSSKAKGIFPPAIAERLESFPTSLIDTIRWIENAKPSEEIFKKDITQIIEQILYC